MIMLLIIGAQVLGKFLAVSGLPKALANTLVGAALPKWGIFVLIVAMYVVLGMFLDIMSAIIITIPVIFPAITAMGYNPFWFGVILMLVVQMGVLTPPVGLDVFVLSGAMKVPAWTIFRGVLPFVITILVCIAILMAVPGIATVILRTM